MELFFCINSFDIAVLILANSIVGAKELYFRRYSTDCNVHKCTKWTEGVWETPHPTFYDHSNRGES